MFRGPVRIDDEHARVLGFLWQNRRVAEACGFFARRFLERFPGRPAFTVRDCGTLEGPTPISDPTVFAGVLKERIELSLDDPLSTIRYSLKSGPYSCTVSFIDDIPHYHPESKEFHCSTGAQFPYRVWNVPTIRVFPRSRRKPFFGRETKTRDLRQFLAPLAAEMKFRFHGQAGAAFFELSPDTSYDRGHSELLIDYIEYEPEDSCDISDG